jgi:hypothetical protein
VSSPLSGLMRNFIRGCADDSTNSCCLASEHATLYMGFDTMATNKAFLDFTPISKRFLRELQIREADGALGGPIHRRLPASVRGQVKEPMKRILQARSQQELIPQIVLLVVFCNTLNIGVERGCVLYMRR